ncbi:MAG: ATP-binding protein [Planctomycetes bacterium]|nr:ATP-binding protein [Planctomycetota bacterium]
MYKRIIDLDQNPSRSFFLWGPRLTGKSTLLKDLYPEAVYIDLLISEKFIQYQKAPGTLREEIESLLKKEPDRRRLVIIDEIQKVPALLDEVHWLIENRHMIFGLCGSSARKVRHGHANLLGGRADRFELFGLVYRELGRNFSLERILNHGYLPSFYDLSDPERALRSYCADYLKEEIAAEGLVRNLPQFSTFLEAASLSDSEIVNYATIARDCGISAPTVKSHFEILADTLMASFLPAYQKRPKRRVVTSPRFYFFDAGVVNHLAKRGKLHPGSELFGKAFENWLYHEIRAHRAYTEKYYDLSYWRLSTGVEVDFILGAMECAVEAKSSRKITTDHMKGLRELKKDHPKVKRSIIASLESTARDTADGIEIMPYGEFLEALWDGQII